MLTPVGGAAQRAGWSPARTFFRCRPTFRWLGKDVARVSSMMELFGMLMQEGRKLQVCLSSVARAYNEVLSSRLVWFGVSCIFLSVD